MDHSTLIVAAAAVVTLWLAGAIYYDVCRGARWSRWLALGWAVAVATVFALWQPLWQPFAALVALLALFLLWWFRQRPSHDRDWDPSVALLPRAARVGDVVTLENVRNFEYHSAPDDFTPRYETRTVHLTNLAGADIIFFYWSSPWMSHPVLVFDFGRDGRICMSIEVRYRKGQAFSILRSFYRQQELIFIAADERDVILRRTKFGQQAYLYRFMAGVEELGAAFLDYVEAINSLCDKPRWYHALCANCTTTFYSLPNSRCRFDWRVLANERLDSALYKAGRLDRTAPFADLRRCALVTEIANAAPVEGFGDHIRRGLESYNRDQGVSHP